MKFSYLLIAFLFLAINGCSDFSSEADEFELSGKMYACDESVHGDIANDTKAGKKQYCNGLRWIDLIPEDSTAQNVSNTQIMYVCKNGAVVKFKNLCSEKPSDYLPLDDTEYPYAGIPRIVIETENHRAIKDRETEIPAKLQIWGESAPESEIMELTIRGRGNTTWNYPKKPYAINFKKKQSFLGMAPEKKWVLLANYRDRTLIRNALAFEIARQSNIGWTPQGKFTELFLNGKFLGSYYVCEKIEIKKNRLNIDQDSYLLELDKKYDAISKFNTSYKKLPVNIKYPSAPSKEKIDYIRNFLDTAETMLYLENHNNIDFERYLDYKTFALYWIIHELTTNMEPVHPKSVFMYKEKNKPLKLGPIWDFDWETFVNYRNGLKLKNSLWFDTLRKNTHFNQIVKKQWTQTKDQFQKLTEYVDSLANYTFISNERNHKIWPILIGDCFAGDEYVDFFEAIQMIKNNYTNRIIELDSLFIKLQ